MTLSWHRLQKSTLQNPITRSISDQSSEELLVRNAWLSQSSNTSTNVEVEVEVKVIVQEEET